MTGSWALQVLVVKWDTIDCFASYYNTQLQPSRLWSNRLFNVPPGH